MEKVTASQPLKNIYLKSMVKETKDNSKMIIEKGDELTKRSTFLSNHIRILNFVNTF